MHIVLCKTKRQYLPTWIAVDTDCLSALHGSIETTAKYKTFFTKEHCGFFPADTDGWLTMTVHDGGFKHTAQKAEHISKGQSLPLLWWLVASALVPCLLDFLPMLVQSPTSPGEKREAL